MMLLPKALTIFFTVFTLSVLGQQDPLFASEGQRSFWFNPASIGTFNSYSINSIGRKQWVGADGSPASIELNGALKYLKIGGKDIPFSAGAIGLGYRYETVGFFRSHVVTVPLNMQFKLSNTYLSIGVSPGIQNLSFEGVWIPPTPEPDPIIPPYTSTSQTKFTTGAGIQWYGRNFSIGFASTHLLQESFDEINYDARRHYYLNGSYLHSFSDEFALQAIAVARTDAGITSVQGLISAVLGSKNKMSVGLGYRNGNALIGALTARFDRFYCGYFVEYFNSILYNGGFSHEFRVAFELFDKNL